MGILLKTKLIISHTLIAAIAAVSSYVAVTPSTPFDHVPLRADNSCLIDSIVQINIYEAAMRLRMTGAWSKVMLFQYKDKDRNLVGHAVCGFEFRERFFTYDPEKGSWQIYNGNLRTDPPSFWLLSVLPDGASDARINNIF